MTNRDKSARQTHTLPAPPCELSWPADKSGEPLRRADHGYTLVPDSTADSVLVFKHGSTLGLYVVERDGHSPNRVTLRLNRAL